MAEPVADEELLSMFIGGDRAAFEELVARHRDRVFQFARWQAEETREGADDLAQEIWLQIFKSAASFRGDASFKAWLYGVGRNVCYGWSRRRALTRRFVAPADDELLLEVSDGAPPPLDVLERSERERLVKDAVERLPSHQRVALLLREWEGLSYEEIAAALEIPVGTVRSRLHNALVRLDAELAAHFKEESHGS